MQIQTIMIATDFSDEAAGTYPHAAALAKLTGARVILFTVNEALEHDHPAYSWMKDHLREVDRRRLQLIDTTSETLRRLGVRATVQVRAGDAAEELCDYVREHGVDLVLMGQRGLRAVKRLLLGRTVRRTLRRIDVPVLVVPPVDGASSAVDEIPALPTYGRLLAATDFTRASRLNLRASIELATVLDAKVEVLHVLRIPMLAPNLGELETWPLVIPEESRDELETQLLAEVSLANTAAGWRRYTCTVTTAYSVAEAIVAAARKLKVSMITIPTRGRRRVREVLFGSTTESVLRLASVPVLVSPVDQLVARYEGEAPR